MSTRKKDLPYANSGLPIEQRVEDLLKRMTLEEKIAQLQCRTEEVEEAITEKGIGELGCFLRQYSSRESAEMANRIQKLSLEKTRLGIPIIIHDEAVHGLIGNGATSFPQAIGLAATWDTELMERVARVIAKETRSRGIRQVLSPVLNITRDARWGRIEESYGEDPFLTSRMGVAFCKSFEKEGVITTPKHFAANVGDGGRDSDPIHFSERLLREVYFPAFKACFQEANAGSIMPAYNSVDGSPCAGNYWLLTDILRKEWKFRGFTVSDYDAVGQIVYNHHTAATKKEAAKQAIGAGLDVELPNIDIYGSPLLEAVKEGLVSESTIDEAVRRILRAKFRLGLFENPYVDPKVAEKITNSSEHRSLTLEAACKAIVLLKNKNNLLPLKKNIKSVAVIGPNANAVRLGGYSGFGMKVVTLLEGIKHKVSATTKVIYAQGCTVPKHPMDFSPVPAENLLPPDAKVGVFGLKGEYFNNMDLSGKPVLTRIDPQIAWNFGFGSPDPKMNPDHFSARWTGKLVPLVSGIYRIAAMANDGMRLFIDGRLVIDCWHDNPAAFTDCITTMELQAGRHYDIRLEFYENKGFAFMYFKWEVVSNATSDIRTAVEAARGSDVVIVAVGILEGEGRDRGRLDLPGSQEELIKAVAETGTPTIVVLMNGSPVTMSNWIDEVPIIIEAWYPGEEGGNAIADVLFGDYNPGGKLPITFPKDVGQVPIYYNRKPVGRGLIHYNDVSGRPLFPFGYGLSYTTFEYSNLKISPRQITSGEKVRISVDVQNVGDREGDEVVQLYLHDVVASVVRPLKELKGFKRISLEPKEKKTVVFELMLDDLSFPDKDLKMVVEPGVFEVMIGTSSEDICLHSTFEYVEE